MPVISIEDAVAKSNFDIIVIGGGTSGLVLAVRIAELEEEFQCTSPRGRAHVAYTWKSFVRLDLYVGKLCLLGSVCAKPDADTEKEPQARLDDRVMPLDHGKGLGGSSAVWRFFQPTVNELDAFEKLGNPGWNAASLDRCLQKSLIAAS
ncbi:hypothetical protein MPER_11720 [Moniliophthora perniciosa FA553]|nr:hypothetical protein MPER_11720 [Moniliophthora perniciosa FA553]